MDTKGKTVLVHVYIFLLLTGKVSFYLSKDRRKPCRFLAVFWHVYICVLRECAEGLC